MEHEAEVPIRLAVIVGSTREGRFAPTVSAWVLDHLQRHPDLDLDVIDLAEVTAEQLDATDHPEGFRTRVGRADAFVVVTPEFNHGYPGPLKHAIDQAYGEWFAKPVAFVSYGGSSGGLRATEQLRQVFAELHTVTVRDAVALRAPWGRLDPDGGIDASKGEVATAERMVDQLLWWARALRAARVEVPYVA